MRDATRLMGLAGLLFVVLALRPAVATTSASAEAEITRLEDDWRTARIKGDTVFLEHFYAKDLVIQGMNGSALPRDEDIALFASGQIRPSFIDHGPLRIQLMGDTAVVTGTDHLGGTYKGHTGEMNLRFTDVFFRRDGRWQLVATQATKIADPAH